jgi:hypothetical protein
MELFQASCHCGKVKCSFSKSITTVVQCHCENCRKLQGSDFSTWVVIPDNQLKVTEGEVYISDYEFNDRSKKCFCSLCGTVVYGVNGKHFKEHKLIVLGAVENYSETLKPQRQVYTESKALWNNF